ncbi:hypothetical protein KC348_g6868, partial [Hortaea werneckii]
PASTSGKEEASPSIPATAISAAAANTSPADPPPKASPPPEPAPTAAELEEDQQQEIIPIPTHPALRLAHTSQQDFNKWSRRLLIYARLPEDQVPPEEISEFRTRRAERERREREERGRERDEDWSGKGEGSGGQQECGERDGEEEGREKRKGRKKGGQTADELNAFRKRYFQGFREV